MSPTIRIGVFGLLLSVAPASAAGFNAEADFVTRASMVNLIAVAESRLALGRASNPTVKDYARRLAEDHGRAEATLQAAAIGSGAKVLTTLDPDGQGLLTALQGKLGADFDKAYVADQLAVHSNSLTLYGDYMLLGDNEKLNELAITMIPVVEAQLKDAQVLPSPCC